MVREVVSIYAMIRLKFQRFYEGCASMLKSPQVFMNCVIDQCITGRCHDKVEDFANGFTDVGRQERIDVN